MEALPNSTCSGLDDQIPAIKYVQLARIRQEDSSEPVDVAARPVAAAWGGASIVQSARRAGAQEARSVQMVTRAASDCDFDQMQKC